jgi:hypothetical protein
LVYKSWTQRPRSFRDAKEAPPYRVCITYKADWAKKRKLLRLPLISFETGRRTSTESSLEANEGQDRKMEVWFSIVCATHLHFCFSLQGHSKYHAIVAALLAPLLDRKTDRQRMESCLSLPDSKGTPTLGTVNTGLFQRCSALACWSLQRQRLLFQPRHQGKPIHSL